MKTSALRHLTVVITGASSGIGRAAALTFARHGATLLLAARRAEVLADVAAECERLGARAHAVPTDATDAAAVQRLADAALSLTGRLDVWVNNAGSGAIGPFEQVPLAAHEQVLRLNLLGTLYGAYAALPHFRRQGRGTLINVVSLGAWVPEPYTASYTASKYGVRGLMDAIRAEVSDAPAIRVCDVHPAFVDTPGFQHGANYTGRRVRPVPPVFRPEQVAEAIVRLVRRPRRFVWVGWSAPLLRWSYALAPGLMGAALRRFAAGALRQATPVPVSSNSLFAPAPAPHGSGVSGGWREASPAPSTGRWVGTFLAAGAATALGVYAWRQRQAE